MSSLCSPVPSAPAEATLVSPRPMRVSLFFILAAFMVSVPVQALNHPAEVVVRVVEETGEVVTNAQVLVSFNQHSQGGVSIVKEGTTDTMDLFGKRRHKRLYLCAGEQGGLLRINSSPEMASPATARRQLSGIRCNQRHCVKTQSEPHLDVCEERLYPNTEIWPGVWLRL